MEQQRTMRLKKFLIISAVVAAIYAVLNWLCSGNLSSIQLWSILVAIGAILPAIIAYIAQHDKFTSFIAVYLSIKRTNWRKTIFLVMATAVILPIGQLLFSYILGNLLQIKFFGSVNLHFNTALFGFLPFAGSTITDLILYTLAQIIYLAIFGSVLGVFNSVFEEIAWRGFLIKYLPEKNNVSLAIITGAVWTIWWLAMSYTLCDVSYVIMTAISNIVMSFYLVKVTKSTGSVWGSSMIRGIIGVGAISAYLTPASVGGNTLLTILIVLILATITLRSRDKRQ